MRPSIYNIPFDFTEEEAKLYPSRFEEPKEEYRFVREAQAENYQLFRPDQIAAYFTEYVFTPFEQFTQEEMWCLLCDSQNTVKYEAMVYRGTVDSVHLRIGELFRSALIYNTPCIALSHNHPSGSSLPSTADIQATEDIVLAGKLLGVHVLDHVIIGRESYTSLMQKQLGGL